MTIACHLVITGLVQGVFFRAWTKEQADALGVTGWVRNCADGSVEAHVEGDEEAVAALIKQLHQGPPSAQVERVDANETGPVGSDRFEIRH